MVSPKVPVRVLHLLTVPADFTGLPGFALRISRLMEPGHVHADFLTFYVADERIREQIEADGSTLYVVPSRLRHPLRYLRTVSRLIRENHYGIVHCHGNSCTLALDLLAAQLGGAKIRIAHSHNSTCRFALLHHLLRPLFNRLYTHAFACGKEAGRWLFGKKPFTVIPNAIDTRRFSFDPAARHEIREEFHLCNSLVLGHISNYVPAKNPLFLLEVFRKVRVSYPDSRLLLVGDGPLRADVEAHAAELNLSGAVCFTGARGDVPRLLQAMDAFLLPSQYEGFPTVALEAQCAGLPTLLSDAVTRDCALADNVYFVATDAAQWADILMNLPASDRFQASADGIRAVSQRGYDLRTAAAQLQAFYLESITSQKLE